MRIDLNKMTQELTYLKNWRIGFVQDSFSLKKAQRILNRSKKKTHRLCAKFNKVLYACRECKGSGLTHYHDGSNFISFGLCKKCDSFGALTWIDRIIRG